MGGALGIEVDLRRTAEHQGEHDLGEEDSLQVWLRLDGRGQPGVELVRTEFGDGVGLPVGPRTWLSFPAADLAVPGEPPERGVHLPERQRLVPPEVRVISAFELIAVARLALEQAQKGQRNG